MGAPVEYGRFIVEIYLARIHNQFLRCFLGGTIR